MIEAALEGGTDRWTIAGRPLSLWRDTAVRRHLETGRLVRVEGVLEPNGAVRIVALKLLEPRPDAPKRAVLVAGPVTAVSGEDRAIIGGFRILLTPETQSDGMPMPLGAWAWVTGTLAPDGTIHAASIRVVAEGR